MPQAVYTTRNLRTGGIVSIGKLTACGALLLNLLTARTLSAGQTAETWSFLTPVAVGNCQSFQGPTAQEAATIGLVGVFHNRARRRE